MGAHSDPYDLRVPRDVIEGTGPASIEDIHRRQKDPVHLEAGEPCVDSDRDGMPDAFEARHRVGEATHDPDGDGYLNIEEYLNGTDPNRPDGIDLMLYATLEASGHRLHIGRGRDRYELELPFGETEVPRVAVTSYDDRGAAPGTSQGLRVSQPESLPGDAVVELLGEGGAVLHRATVRLTQRSLPDVRTYLWETELADFGDQVVYLRGDVPLTIEAPGPASMFARVEAYLVPIADHGTAAVSGSVTDRDATAPEGQLRRHVLYSSANLPRQTTLDTLEVDDGAYTLVVRVETALNTVFETGRSVVVDNWDPEVDELRPPTFSEWFGWTSRRRTVSESAGWQDVTTPAQSLFGDADRLARQSLTDEYLVWKVKPLDRVILTLYARDESLADGVRISVSDDMADWRDVQFTVSEREQSAEGGRNWSCAARWTRTRVRNTSVCSWRAARVFPKRFSSGGWRFSLAFSSGVPRTGRS